MKTLRYIYCLIAISVLAGCESDDTEAVSDGGIIADFSFTSDGSEFVFSNLSQGATMYRWDFGDLSFYCDKENPKYQYTKVGGEINVTLTAMGESGQEAHITKTITAPEVLNVEIGIDGDFGEWEGIPITYDESASGGGSIQKIKVYAKGDEINVYLEGNATMKLEVVDIFIDADGDPSTGFLSWQWPVSSGAEFLIEGAFLNNSWGDLYNHADPNGGWAWNVSESTANIFSSSGVVQVDAQTNAVEFSFPKSKLGSLGTYIGLAITEMTEGWAAVASFPTPTDTSSFVIYELPLEATFLCE